MSEKWIVWIFKNVFSLCVSQDVPSGGSSIKLYTRCSSLKEGGGGLDSPSADLSAPISEPSTWEKGPKGSNGASPPSVCCSLVKMALQPSLSLSIKSFGWNRACVCVCARKHEVTLIRPWTCSSGIFAFMVKFKITWVYMLMWSSLVVMCIENSKTPGVVGPVVPLYWWIR